MHRRLKSSTGAPARAGDRVVITSRTAVGVRRAISELRAEVPSLVQRWTAGQNVAPAQYYRYYIIEAMRCLRGVSHVGCMAEAGM